MLIVAVRTLILYVLVLFAMRLMGKSELSKMSPFQLVIVFMIAELAAIISMCGRVSINEKNEYLQYFDEKRVRKTVKTENGTRPKTKNHF